MKFRRNSQRGTYESEDGRWTIERKHGIPSTWWLIHDKLGKLARSFTSADTLAEAKENIKDWLEDERH